MMEMPSWRGQKTAGRGTPKCTSTSTASASPIGDETSWLARLIHQAVDRRRCARRQRQQHHLQRVGRAVRARTRDPANSTTFGPDWLNLSGSGAMPLRPCVSNNGFMTDQTKARPRPSLPRGGFVAWLCCAAAMVLAAYGDMNDHPVLRALGIGAFLVAFVVFGYFVMQTMTKWLGSGWWRKNP